MVLSLFFISFFNENGNGKNEFFESLFETRGKKITKTLVKLGIGIEFLSKSA